MLRVTFKSRGRSGRIWEAEFDMSNTFEDRGISNVSVAVRYHELGSNSENYLKALEVAHKMNASILNCSMTGASSSGAGIPEK